jgi:hypothetical protein
MSKTWVLHTETKGTGAQMVPLERTKKSSSTVEPVLVPRKRRRPKEAEAPKPRPPRRFKVVDVMTREILADDVLAREAIEVLADVDSVVDVNVYMWQEERARWRMLTFAERKTMWELAREPAAERAPAHP